MAVGPLEPVESWVTGGTATVAKDRDLRSPWFVDGRIAVDGLRAELRKSGALLGSCASGARMDMVAVSLEYYLGVLHCNTMHIMELWEYQLF
jgi:hypothetical protein